MRTPSSWMSIAGAVCALLSGCAPAIGDSCGTAYDCSVNGDRTCDLALPSGSCTVFGCEADNCPDEGVCVRWRPEPSRLSFNACMRRCVVDTDCRMDEGYRCLATDDVTTIPGSGVPIAEVLGDDLAATFCVATEPISDVEE